MIIAYIRCSTQKQQTSHQRHEIQEYADKNGLMIDRWVEETISSRKSLKKRKHRSKHDIFTDYGADKSLSGIAITSIYCPNLTRAKYGTY